jgi:hypothetical protein
VSESSLNISVAVFYGSVVPIMAVIDKMSVDEVTIDKMADSQEVIDLDLLE